MHQKTIAFNQVQIQYSPEEDRIIMRLNTKTDEQFVMAFTRKYIQTFWPALVQVLSSDPNFVAYDAATKQAAVAFQHQDIIENANYEQPFKMENLSYPWGKAPLLANKAVIKTPENSLLILGIYTIDNVGFEFPSNHNILHYLYKGLSDLVGKIGWSINLQSLLANNSVPDKNRLN